MEDYMGEKVMIGDWVVDGIEMFGNDTCVLYLGDFNEGDEIVSPVIEKWLDDDKFIFLDNYFEEDGTFINEEETTHLTDEEKEKCKEFINSWLEDLNK